MVSVAADRNSEPVGPYLVIDRPAKRAWWRGARLDLSRTEFALLAVLADAFDQAVPRHTITWALWGSDSPAACAYLDLYIRYLRHRLSDNERYPGIVHQDEHGIRLRLSDAQIDQRVRPTMVLQETPRASGTYHSDSPQRARRAARTRSA